MKKIILSFLLVIATLFVVACEPKPDETDELQEILDGVNLSTSYLRNRTSDFVIPLYSSNGTGHRLAWESNSPAAAIQAHVEGENTLNVVVTRPEAEFGDATFVLTVTVTFQDRTATKQFTGTVTALVAATISTIPDIFTSLGQTLQINDVVVVGLNTTTRGYYVSDGEYVIYVYQNAAHSRQVGDVGNVRGQVQEYFGSFQLANTPSFEKTGERPLPTATLTSLSGKWFGSDANDRSLTDPWLANPSNNKLWVTEGVILRNAETNNYFLAPAGTTSLADITTDYVLVSSYSTNYNDLIAIAGNVGMFTFVNSRVFSGGIINSQGVLQMILEVNIVGAQVQLGDEAAVNADTASLSITQQVIESGSILLPTEGEQGSVITWHSGSPEIINVETGEVVAGENLVPVILTATITKGDEVRTKEFIVEVGPIEKSTIHEATSYQDGHQIWIEGVITHIAWSTQYSNGDIYINDGTAGIHLFRITTAVGFNLETMTVGTSIRVLGIKTSNNGNPQIGAAGATITAIEALPVVNPIELTNDVYENLTANINQYVTATLYAHSSITGLVPTAANTVQTLYLANGHIIPIYIVNENSSLITANLISVLNTVAAGNVVNITGVITRSSQGLFRLNPTTIAIAETPISESILTALIEETKTALFPVEDNAFVNSNLTLSLVGPFGTTVAWTSSVPSTISNEGVVTRGGADIEVLLTATVTIGGGVVEHSITVTVLATGETLPGGVFISEIYEGRSGQGNTKAIELYNASNVAIDLAEYRLVLHDNTATTPRITTVTGFVGIVQPGTTFTIGHADFAANTGTATNIVFPLTFNGGDNDYIELYHGELLIDSVLVTADSNVTRKPEIIVPNNVWTAEEWIVTAITAGNFPNTMGTHTVV